MTKLLQVYAKNAATLFKLCLNGTRALMKCSINPLVKCEFLNRDLPKVSSVVTSVDTIQHDASVVQC